ncbi:MAG: hypothetical protein ACHBN1_06890 [Heteroscytonema crispum UTEX LB 1556]
MAPLPRARSEPEGIFPTADASAPTPTNQQPTTNYYQFPAITKSV